MTESISMTVGSGSVSGQVVFSFQKYGAAVDVTQPPASDVMSYEKYISHYGS